MRLIDADRLLQGCKDHDFIDTHIIWNAPTVDAVPVIRCKDCKHMHEDGVESYCDDSGRYIDGTGFCKWAERKEE